MAKKGKRWGKKFIDKRVWKVENRKYVVRGEFLLDLDWAKNWDAELNEMNKGKKGSPYKYPESLIRLQAIWGQWVDYRGLKGITKKLCEHELIPYYNDFSTIQRRVTKMDIEFELPKEGHISVSTDGSGMKAGNGGEYRERIYGKERKKYLKVIISADPIKRKLLYCDVFIEGEGECEPDLALSHLEALINRGFDIDKFYGDGAFDYLDLFNFLDKHYIESTIKPRTPATCNKPESLARKKEVEKFKKEGYKKWARKKRYGQRWTGTEGIFSAVKRGYGEAVRAIKLENMFKEVKRKFWAYDRIFAYAAT